MKKYALFLLIFNFIRADLWLPYNGFLKGNYHLGFGAHFWSDHIDLRNGQFRLELDLLPGIRYHSVLRSNAEFTGLNILEPTYDENYLEGQFFYTDTLGKLSGSLKIGTMRYLRFPEPDLISQFDQVPGVDDLKDNDAETSYNGQLLTLDYKTKYNLGYHFSGINWDYSKRYGQDIIESYAFYKDSFSFLDIEARYGALQLRNPVGPANVRTENPFQLGRSGEGFDLYLGTSIGNYKVGILYEEIYDDKFKYNDVRTGIIVRFGENFVTEALGGIRFDYTRSPLGMGAHITLAEGNIGYDKNIDSDKYELVGQVEALRVITYWQNGQGRNFYEHKLSYTGDVEGDLLVTVAEKPWYLAVESLVSPHTELWTKSEFNEWEKHRQGPAQLEQKVIYKYYKKLVIE